MQKYILAFLWLCCLPLFASEKDTTDPAPDANMIIWINLNFPPLYIQEGEFKGEGYTDKLITFLAESLPEYQHKISFFPNYSAIEREIQSGAPICDAAAFYQVPEDRNDSSNWLFSAPHTVFFMHNLVVLTESKAKFDRIPSLSNLLKDKGLVLGIQKGRPLGDILDSVLERYQYPSISLTTNIIRRASPDYVGLYQMLLRHEIDYLIDYYPQMAYAAKRLDIPESTFTLLPLAEISKPYGLASIRCEKSMTQVISDINRVLKIARPGDAFQALTKRWGVRQPNPQLADSIYKTQVLSRFE